MAVLNFYDIYTMLAVTEEIVPPVGFFKDRYFPTAAEDIFNSDKVLTEYRKGDRKMAAFVSPRVGDIPMDREGYAIHEYVPPYIAPSRLITLDDLKKRGFGEALYPGETQAQRALKLQRRDFTEMEDRISRREEWMCVQTMLNNACTMQEYIDDKTVGETLYVKFFDSTSDHTYTIGSAYRWDGLNGDFFGDVKAMCRQLAKRGLPAVDLILGSDTADAVMKIQEVRDLLKKDSGIIVGEIDPRLTKYDGTAFLGTLNFRGHNLNVYEVAESYVDGSNQDTPFFPAKGAMVTAPGCGHLMYGSITQINYGSTDYETYARKRVPKLVIDQDKDIRKVRYASRPLAAPRNYCPWMYAADAVS